MTSHDHLIEGSCELMRYVTNLISLVTIRNVIVEMLLICYVASCEHMFQGLRVFMGGSPSPSHHLAMFGGHWSSASGDIKYLICHVTSQNHVIERSSNFMSESSSWHVTTLPSLVPIGIVAVEMFLVCHLIK